MAGEEGVNWCGTEGKVAGILIIDGRGFVYSEYKSVLIT